MLSQQPLSILQEMHHILIITSDVREGLAAGRGGRKMRTDKHADAAAAIELSQSAIMCVCSYCGFCVFWILVSVFF